MVNQNIPKWISKELTSDQAEKISAQIKSVESKTRAELVAVVVPRSSAVAHVPWVLMMLLGTIFFIAEGVILGLHWDRRLEILVPAAAIGIYFVSVLLSRLSYVQRILTPNVDEVWQVQQRAELEFYRTGITKTDQGTGVLIFVSWMERRAVILADKGVSSLCPESIWQETVDAMLAEFKSGSFHSGLEKTIHRCGEILIEKLPSNGNKSANQLPNHLIIR